MKWLLILALAFLVPAIVIQSNDDFLEHVEDLRLTDGNTLHDWFKPTTPRSGTRAYGKASKYNRYLRSIQKDSFKVKVVGGRPAKAGQIPWQASVKLLHNGVLTHSCGAVIINKYWLLSAAHCFDDPLQPKRWVTVGELRLGVKDKGQQTFEVDRIFKHTLYNKMTNDYDAALIRIKPLRRGRGIQFNKSVKAIRLSSSRTSVKVGASLLVSGWGWTKPCVDCKPGSQNVSPVLMKADIRLISPDKCKELYKTSITDRMFCAGYIERPIDSCSGDSGGPVAFKSGGSYRLYGIVSWGQGCAQINKPGVYTRVPILVPWILQIMKQYKPK
ncbi:hypothetical protein BsWGS_19415 [Bradybaena similaris]